MLSSSRRLLTPSNLRVCTRCLSTITRTTPRLAVRSHRFIRSQPLQTNTLRTFTSTAQRPASHTSADGIVEHIESLYSDAKDEFEMAAEETEGNTVYAADDRAEAQRLIDELKAFYDSVVGEESPYPGEIREEVKKRAGQRVREIVNAMVALEEQAMNQD